MKKVILVGCFALLASGCAHRGSHVSITGIQPGERYIFQMDQANAVLESPEMHHKNDRGRLARHPQDAEWVK